jgi:transcriptional regulator with XRE-family HTH domain
MNNKNDIGINKLDHLIQERLESLLVKRKISRRQLSQEIGISDDYLGKMIRGLRPWKLIYLKQVAEVLDVSLDTLFKDTVKLPVVAEIGDQNKGASPFFDYKAVVLQQKGRDYVPFPELPKRLAAETYVVKVAGSDLMPGLLPGSYLYIARGIGNSSNLKDGDLVVYVTEDTDYGYVTRIERDKTHIHFHFFYKSPIPSSGKDLEATLKPRFIKKLADIVSGIDVVVAIVLHTDFLFPK